MKDWLKKILGLPIGGIQIFEDYLCELSLSTNYCLILHMQLDETTLDNKVDKFLLSIFLHKNGCQKIFSNDECESQKIYDWEKEMQSQNLQYLTYFSIVQYKVSFSGIQLLGRLEWPNLNKFSLSSCQIRLEELKQLLKNQHFAKLNQLSLDQNPFGDEGMDAILTTKGFTRLQRLQVGRIGISGVGLRVMPDRTFNRLKNLDLSQNLIGKRGVQFLVKADLPMLQHLSLRNCQIGAEGARHLIKQNWPNLIDLYLFPSNNMGFDGRWALANGLRNRKQYHKVLEALFSEGYSIGCYASVVLNSDYFFHAYMTSEGEVGFRKYLFQRP